ncbi:MAG: hypothetical protein ABJB40_14320 [Acidobacteriota bacterium]
MMMFFDIPPTAAGVGVFAAVAFLLIGAAVAFVAYKLLKKTVKMAFRMVIVGVILAIAVAGSLSFWWLGGGKPSRSEPRTRPTQQK